MNSQVFCLLLCSVFCAFGYGQNPKIPNSIFDSAYFKTKIIKTLMLGSEDEVKIAQKLESNSKDAPLIYISKRLDTLSNRFDLYEISPLVGHYNKSIFCVWDKVNKIYVDSITLHLYNEIIKSSQKRLNNYDKVTLYNLLVLNLPPLVYGIKVKIKKSSVNGQVNIIGKVEKLYFKSFLRNSFLELAGFYYGFEPRPEISCNKNLLKLLNKSDNNVFYFPFFMSQSLSTTIANEIQKVTLQVFYFNDKGELVNTFWLYDFMEIKSCDTELK
jgi:hypothetical protein